MCLLGLRSTTQRFILRWLSGKQHLLTTVTSTMCLKKYDVEFWRWLLRFCIGLWWSIICQKKTLELLNKMYIKRKTESILYMITKQIHSPTGIIKVNRARASQLSWLTSVLLNGHNRKRKLDYSVRSTFSSPCPATVKGKKGNGKKGNGKLGNGKLGNRKIGQRKKRHRNKRQHLCNRGKKGQRENWATEKRATRE